jgi:hypothetical protein
VSGGKLRLEAAKSNDKAIRAGDFGVIWDGDVHQGYAFCEALQGYSPVSEAVHCTNLLAQGVVGETERIEGHAVDKVNVTLLRSDGQTMVVQMLRSQDMGHWPLKICWPAETPYSFALALSNFQRVRPADELFEPPDGFTKYGSEAAMLNELADRQQNASGEKPEHSGAGENNQPVGGHRSPGSP